MLKSKSVWHLFTYSHMWMQLYFNQVCCSGMLYTKKPRHHCCEGSYLSLNNSSDPVCCNGKLLPALPDYKCCVGYYVHVKNSEYRSLLLDLHIVFSFLHDWSLSFLMLFKCFVCPCLCRWKLLSWPLTRPGLSGTGWQLLWGGSLLHERWPALL